ncbi:hypothetical protein [Streptomyces sp. NPDC048172]|uniref:hypothetical protein n=1 Tax=Streptomyces sp. NPDC048172 TaxID=3365505 RepID=UPI003715E2C9
MVHRDSYIRLGISLVLLIASLPALHDRIEQSSLEVLWYVAWGAACAGVSYPAVGIWRLVRNRGTR